MNLIKTLNNKNYLIKIIYLNIIVFVVINIITTIWYLFGLHGNSDLQRTLLHNLGASSNINILIKKPWTLITHMFTHFDIFHGFFNLCYLYFGGKIFIDYLSQKNLLYTYIMGGLTGYIFYLISLSTFPAFEGMNENTIALGASASSLAVLIASATYVPNLSINIIWLNSIKLKYIAIILIIIDFLSIINGNPGAHIAHIGGAVYGFIYVYIRENIITEDLNNKISSFKKSYKYKKESDYEYNNRKNIEQQKIDRILDKISRSGYDSLSENEKQKLFDQK